MTVRAALSTSRVDDPPPAGAGLPPARDQGRRRPTRGITSGPVAAGRPPGSRRERAEAVRRPRTPHAVRPENRPAGQEHP